MSGIDAPVSLQPLISWWQGRNPPHLSTNCTCSTGGVCGSVESLRRTIEAKDPLSRSTLYRRTVEGRITLEEADRWAVALGASAYAIWPGFDRLPVTASLSSDASRPARLFG